MDNNGLDCAVPSQHRVDVMDLEWVQGLLLMSSLGNYTCAEGLSGFRLISLGQWGLREDFSELSTFRR